MHEYALEDLANRVRALCADGGRKLLGLAGAPGAGKSTLAQQLAAAMPERAIIVPMDGFHLANSQLRRLGREARKGAPDTFDSAGYVALLRRLREQTADDVVYAPEFRRDIEEPIAGAIAVTPDCRLIVTEGNYLLLDSGDWRNVRELLDEIWYIDIDWRVRTQRLVARHIAFGRDASAARDWVAHSDEPNAVLIESTRSRADAIVRLRGAG